MNPIVEARGLSKRFGEVEALSGLDLVAESGHVTALLGPNGAGKTTFISTVATLLRPDGGELRVAGIDATSEPQRVRQILGLAGQFASVEPAMTGRENLDFVGRLFGLDRREAQRAATAVLDRLGLTDDANRLVRTGIATPLAPRGSGAGFLTATGQTARRTILQFLRTPQLLMMPAILGALFLFIFRYIFGGAIATGSEVDYVAFLVPGFLVQTTLWTAMNVPAGVAEDSSSGVYDRLRSLPIPRSAVMAGRSIADTALNSWAVVVTTLLGVAVGFRTHSDPVSIVAAFALILAAIYAFTWIFISLGLLASNAQAAQGMATLIVVPFTFASNAFVPISSMPGWLQSFASNQPVTVIINAVRSLMLGGTDAAGVGHSTGYWVVLSLLWCAGIVAVFSAVAVARFARTR